MPNDLDERYRRVLATQLTMNKQTWLQLQAHGVSEATELQLDFIYAAPDQVSATSLKAGLDDQTDYAVRVELADGRFAVIGSTRPTALSLDILDQWVDWMVTAGLHKNCEFDGWGTEV